MLYARSCIVPRASISSGSEDGLSMGKLEHLVERAIEDVTRTGQALRLDLETQDEQAEVTRLVQKAGLHVVGFEYPRRPDEVANVLVWAVEMRPKEPEAG